MIEKRDNDTKSFFSWLKIWGVWTTTASHLVGHRVKWPKLIKYLIMNAFHFKKKGKKGEKKLI
jgi:hypothetical protein